VRVRIIFLLKNKGSFVPFYHQHLLAQVAESVLLEGNRSFDGFENFNFSGLKGQTKISKNGLHFYSSRVTLVLSSPKDEFVEHFLQGIFRMKEILVGTLQLVPESVEKELTPIFTESVKYVCISPLVVADPINNYSYTKKFISPETDLFSDLMYESTMNRMEKSGSYTAEQIASFYKFQIVPDHDYLQKIKEEEKKFARIYPVYDINEKYEVSGYTFPFTLYSAPEVQNFLFESGLGYFANKGFGMLDLANADSNRRTEPYPLAMSRQLSS
jgi:CRISPR-associated endoribonuclease Cas6